MIASLAAARTTGAALASLLLVTTAWADDWPQWQGPQQDGVWRETGIVETLPPGGPPVRWRVPVGSGYSGPAVVGHRVYVTDRQLAAGAQNPSNAFSRGAIPGTERVLCLDDADGHLLWKHEYESNYTMSYAAGPRATPLVSEGKVYTLGGEGQLFCLDAETGKPLWSHDFPKEYQARTPTWGFAAHPLLAGHQLICLVGGPEHVVVAFDKDTGKESWQALSAKSPGYSTPILVHAGGREQLIVWHPESVNSLEPETGKLFWTYPWQVKTELSVATPRFVDNQLFLTSFYSSARLLKLDPAQPGYSVAWEGHGRSEKNTETLHSLISTPFIENGYIYGVCSYGELRCLKLATGERVWENLTATGANGRPIRWATAFLVKQGDRFWLPNEKGDLILAKLTSQGYQELGKTHLLDPTNHDPGREVVWSHPAFAHRNIYWRNDKELVCASLAAPTP